MQTGEPAPNVRPAHSLFSHRPVEVRQRQERRVRNYYYYYFFFQFTANYVEWITTFKLKNTFTDLTKSLHSTLTSPAVSAVL